MYVSIDKIIRGINNYFENEIGSKATGVKKFGAYFIIARYNKIFPTLIADYASTLGVLNSADNTVDIDAIYSAAKEAYSHSGQFTMAGIIFNESDIDKLYNEVKNA